MNQAQWKRTVELSAQAGSLAMAHSYVALLGENIHDNDVAICTCERAQALRNIVETLADIAVESGYNIEDVPWLRKS